jgi:hypothetical protein
MGMKTYSLDPEQIFYGAADKCGLTKYAEPDVAERFFYMTGLMNDFGEIKESEYRDAVEQLESIVVKRLEVARDWDLHPEILDGEITQPFFVIGNARTGTTFAQMILTMDEGHRTPLYCEVQHPSPPWGLDPAADALALKEQNEYVDYFLKKSPRVMQAHPYMDQMGNAEAEDEYVYSLDFDMVYPLWLLKVPNMPQALPPRDPVRAMMFYKNMLKQFQWKAPTGRWVGKGVVHQYIAPSILEVFPDSVGFWMHRPPEEYIASLLEILEVQYHPFNGDLYRVQPDELVEQLKAGADYIVKNATTDDPRIHHIRFKDFVSDPAAVIAPIYEKSGIPFTNAFAEKIKHRIGDPSYRADRYGKFQYTLENYGLNGKDIRAKFAEYCDRFEL